MILIHVSTILVVSIVYNHVHNILGLIDGWTNFRFTTSETKRDY